MKSRRGIRDLGGRNLGDFNQNPGLGQTTAPTLVAFVHAVFANSRMYKAFGGPLKPLKPLKVSSKRLPAHGSLLE